MKEEFNKYSETYETESDIENEKYSELISEEPITKTMIHGFTNSYNIYDLQNNQINIALAEGYMPLGIFQDKYSEEMSFPSPFYGEKRPDDIEKNFSYKKIAQWEVLHIDHEFSYHTTNLFYKVICIILNQVFRSIWVRIRKGQLKG